MSTGLFKLFAPKRYFQLVSEGLCSRSEKSDRITDVSIVRIRSKLEEADYYKFGVRFGDCLCVDCANFHRTQTVY